MLAPVASQLQLGLLWRAVLADTGQVDQEWHVATVPAEESHALEVSLNVRSAPNCEPNQTHEVISLLFDETNDDDDVRLTYRGKALSRGASNRQL